MDRINKNMSQTPDTPSGPGQAQIQSVLQAKGGKAGSGAGAQSSGLLAATANQQAQSQLQQGATKGAMVGQQLKAQESQIQAKQKLGKDQLAQQKELSRSGMQAESAMAAEQRAAREEQARNERSANENLKLDGMQAHATQKLRDITTKRGVALDDIFAEFDRSNKELEFRKDQAELEQLGFDLALSDRALLDEYNRIGRERQLSNDLNFQEESANLALGENLSMLKDELSFMKSFNSDRRTWETELAQMDLEAAMNIANASIKDANTTAMITGLGKSVSTGFDQYQKNKNSRTKKDTTTSPGPETGNIPQSSTPFNNNSGGGMLS